MHDTECPINSNSQHDGYKQELDLMVYTFFHKKFRDSAANAGTGIISENQRLANELRRLMT